jgi:hypothetical protein
MPRFEISVVEIREYNTFCVVDAADQNEAIVKVLTGEADIEVIPATFTVIGRQLIDPVALE